MRIDIVGLPASGKSTLARLLSEQLSIPHIHLDRFWFESGGKQGRLTTPNLEEVRARVRSRVEEAVGASSWVSDGTYLHVQDQVARRAEVIVFLDIPLWVRLANHAHRVFFENKRHAELTFWDDLTFFKEIVRREYSSGPKLRRFVEEHADKVMTLRSKKEIREYVQSFHTVP